MFNSSFGQEQDNTPAITSDKSLCHPYISRHIEARGPLCCFWTNTPSSLFVTGILNFRGDKIKRSSEWKQTALSAWILITVYTSAHCHRQCSVLQYCLPFYCPLFCLVNYKGCNQKNIPVSSLTLFPFVKMSINCMSLAMGKAFLQKFHLL